MTRTTKVLVGSALALALGAGGQVAMYHHNAPAAMTVHASWTFSPKSSMELRTRAASIVLARVVAVNAGPDIITKQAAEPDGVDRIPTSRVTVSVISTYKGSASAGQRLTLFQTGGTTSLPAAPAKGDKSATSHVQQVVLEGDPAYRKGEEYLLMLEAGPEGTLRPVSPEGRYRVDSSNGALTAMVSNEMTKQLTAQRLSALEPSLRTG